MNTYSNISTMVVTDDTGTVNFTGGLEPNQQTYFGLENSLEELTAGGGITITQGNSPEPSTLVLFATGLAGVWAIGRRKRA